MILLILLILFFFLMALFFDWKVDRVLMVVGLPGRNSKFGDDHLVYVASGITSRRRHYKAGDQPSFIPTGSRAPSGAVIFSRVSVHLHLRESLVEKIEYQPWPWPHINK